MKFSTDRNLHQHPWTPSTKGRHEYTRIPRVRYYLIELRVPRRGTRTRFTLAPLRGYVAHSVQKHMCVHTCEYTHAYLPKFVNIANIHGSTRGCDPSFLLSAFRLSLTDRCKKIRTNKMQIQAPILTVRSARKSQNKREGERVKK